MPAASRCLIALAKPRGGSIAFASRSSSAAGRVRFAAAISARLSAAIYCRMSDIVRHHNQAVEPALGFAGIDRAGSKLEAALEILPFTGNDQSRRRVQ